LNGQLTPELNETFNYIESGGNRLTRTIDLILNVSKSQNNQYKIKLEEIDLNEEILNPISQEFRKEAEKKGIDIQFEKNHEKFKIVCDQYSVNQLFSNLIENAVKYTNNGSVKIKTFINEVGKIQVDIEDTGIGISSEYVPKLFEPFSQEEQGYTRSYEGIGLGLSLVKNYADLNNAEIKVKSEKEKGSVFSVIFN
jgi:signal transduction histidine kinase